MVVQTEQEPQTAGELIRFWRTRRGLSHRAVAGRVKRLDQASELRRDRPLAPECRQLLVHLAQHPICRSGNGIDRCSLWGFAPPYLEQPFDGR